MELFLSFAHKLQLIFLPFLIEKCLKELHSNHFFQLLGFYHVPLFTEAKNQGRLIFYCGNT